LIDRKIESDPLTPEQRMIRQALVPTQEVVEIKNGKKVNVARKIFPGYVLVEMLLNQDTLHTINGIQGVIKFVGHKDREPHALRPDEVNRLLGLAEEEETVAAKEEIPFMIGQAVAITTGPFTDFNGTVEEVLTDKGKVRVSVSLFGRPTTVELDYLDLKGY
jgi:transcriptional antiterminator NusG